MVLILPPSVQWLGVVAALAFIFVLIITLKAPEITFVLFLFAGQFKASPFFIELSSLFDVTLFMAIMTIFGVLRKILTENLSLKIERKMTMAWMSLCMLMILGLFKTPSINYGLAKTTQFISLSSIAFVTPLVLFTKKTAPVHRFYYAILIFGTAYSFFALQIGIDKASIQDFVFIPGSNYLGLGLVVGMGIIIGLLYLIPRGGRFAIAGVITIMLSGGALLLSGGRGPLLALVVTLLFVALASLVVPARLDRTVVVPSLLLALVFAGLIKFDLLPANISYRLSLLQSGVLEQDMLGSAYERRRLWQSAWDAMGSYPLFGLGSGGFADWDYKMDVRWFPHNPFLEAGAEMGFPGMFLVVYLLWLSLRALFSNSRGSASSVPTRREFRILCTTALGLLIFIWSSAMVSGELDNRPAWMTLALLVSLCKQDQDGEATFRSLAHRS
jgi:O-antigen ligase